MNEPARDEPIADEAFDDAPLPVRVPGRHLSHRPTVAGDDEVSVTDPFRPYRVHELLTRHALGKRRGRAEHDEDLPEAPSSPTPTSPEEQYRHPEDER